ncbi:MAG: hypothetical protein ABTR07_04325 [Candidatus Competibacter denitrificans]
MIADPDDPGLPDLELEQVGEDEVRRRFMRGDYADPSVSSRVNAWLARKASERRFIVLCKKAAEESALDSQRRATKAHKVAIFAAIMAAIANLLAIIALFR